MRLKVRFPQVEPNTVRDAGDVLPLRQWRAGVSPAWHQRGTQTVARRSAEVLSYRYTCVRCGGVSGCIREA